MQRLLPRHMQIIELIHADQMAALETQGTADAKALRDRRRGRADQRVRMGNLAFLGAHRVNGVSGLHSELMKETVFHSLHTAVPRADRQRDQRHHPTPLAA